MNPIKGYKRSDGIVLFFLPSLANKHVGESLPEDEYLQKYAERLKTLPRCADPRCVKSFEPHRGDQKYCDSKCSNRHHAREAYRAANGMDPEQRPTVTTADGAVLVDERLFEVAEALKQARLEIERRPTAPKVRVGGTDAAPIYMMPQQAAKYHVPAHHDPGVRFKKALKLAGFADNEFWDDQFDELYDIWEKASEVLPAKDLIVARFVIRERYDARMAILAEKQRIDEDAQRRCAQLYPNMDRVNADGSLKP